MQQKSRLDSLNFLSNIITLVIIGVGVWGIDLSVDTGEAAKAILDKNWEYLISVTLPSLVTLIVRITKKIQENTIKLKDLFTDMNFVTQGITILALVLTGVGIAIPEDSPSVIADAIFNGSLAGLVLTLIMQLFNPLYHFFTGKEKKENP